MRGETRRWGPPWQEERRTGRFADPEVLRRRLARQDERSGPGPAIAAGFIQVIAANRIADAGGLFRELTWPLILLLLAGPVALLFRRSHPVPVLAVSAAATIWFSMYAAPRWMFAVAPMIALFNLARLGRTGTAVGGGAAGYVAYLVVTRFLAGPLGVPPGARPDLRLTLLLPVAIAVVVFLGVTSRHRRQHMVEMIKVRAERERAKEEQERRQASEERLRMAQELHDVLGHHLSLINVQAGVGLHLMDNRPEQAREALTAIKTASSEALREVRAVLGVLRTDDEAAPRQPAVSLSRLGDLTADAGLPITTEVTGEARELPAEVDRAAYRIVQEALTNVRKHAGEGATASIIVDHRPAALHVTIRNSLTSASAADGDGEGTGIGGMRARAQALGGSLEAGPVDGGFLVSVRLPVGEQS